jgi:hypothetical protein
MMRLIKGQMKKNAFQLTSALVEQKNLLRDWQKKLLFLGNIYGHTKYEIFYKKICLNA